MSGLKNLIKQAKRATGTAGTPSGGPVPVVASTSRITPFAALEYDLNHITPSKAEILQKLATIMAILSSKNNFEDTDRRKFILEFYRLALAQDKRATGCFHPSEISTEQTMCRRKMYFQKARLKPDATYVNFTSDNRMMRLVDLGTLVHLYMQENLDRLGILVDYEVPVESPQHGTSGKTDGVVKFCGFDDLGVFYPEEEMVLEIKTINEFGFKALRKPKPEHLKQASIYGGFLGYKRIVFVYYNKNTSDLKIFVSDIDFEYLAEYKELTSGVISEYNINYRHTRTHDILQHTLPKKLCKSRTVERACNCPFADTCFSIND